MERDSRSRGTSVLMLNGAWSGGSGFSVVYGTSCHVDQFEKAWMVVCRLDYVHGSSWDLVRSLVNGTHTETG